VSTHSPSNFSKKRNFREKEGRKGHAVHRSSFFAEGKKGKKKDDSSASISINAFKRFQGEERGEEMGGSPREKGRKEKEPFIDSRGKEK